MDLEKIISELRAERNRIDEAILAIERISRGAAKRRGRRPKWLAQVTDESADTPERKSSAASSGS
jgi:hypothetical protein